MNVPASNPKAPKPSAENPLAALRRFGQAPWLDFLARTFIADGSLKTLIERDGVTGVTSNPAIFEKAIGGSSDYDSSIRALILQGDRDVMSLYEALAVEDIRNAADVLRPVYDATNRDDGYVSLEVSPYLAMDTAGTVAEAQRLWRAVGRDNLMIKVPATGPGLPAIRQLIGEGINVNITLLFSQDVYEQVALAYIGGLEDFAARGGAPKKVASVASFFISRIDVAVEKQIDAKMGAAGASLRGKVAIANAKLAYERYKRLFSGARWDALKGKGARTQRLLWASTGTKSKELSDVLYVDELIAKDTVNTLPPATMDAFRDHGALRESLEEGIDGAGQVMASIERAGISIDTIARDLVDEGVVLFADAFDKLLGAVAGKRAAILGEKIDSQTISLPDSIAQGVKAEIEGWRRAGKVRKLWDKDASIWTGADEDEWLGWLNILGEQSAQAGQLELFAKDIRAQDFNHVVLIGMGGSSLGPEVLAQTFGRQQERPGFIVLDSTVPAQVRAVESAIDPKRTLFIVSSKSGSTLEPNVLKDYFFERVKGALGAETGSRFVAITDPGSDMEKAARRDGFRHIFYGRPDIGGRYSVLSNFGMVPAAAMGLDLRRFIDATSLMVHSCGAHVPPAENPAVHLGIALGVAAKAGRDKLTVLASEGVADFGAWLEQLVAESTGKRGKAIIPVDGEPATSPETYGDDRIFVCLKAKSDADVQLENAVAALEAAGHPVIRIVINDRNQIGQEFFRWEIATAVAGAVLGINPFDQPDVEASKVSTRKLTSAFEASGALPAEKPFFTGEGVSLFADDSNVAALGKRASLTDYLAEHFARLKPRDYCALLAYVERNAAHIGLLQDMRLTVRDRRMVATCVGFGPRFLHSTGQAYKGGPDTGVFLQITSDNASDVQVPGKKYSFGIVTAAQARGDFDVLSERGRRALRVHLGADVTAGLKALHAAIQAALR